MVSHMINPPGTSAPASEVGQHLEFPALSGTYSRDYSKSPFRDSLQGRIHNRRSFLMWMSVVNPWQHTTVTLAISITIMVIYLSLWSQTTVGKERIPRIHRKSWSL